MEQAQPAPINITNYLRERTAGTAKVVKLNGVPHFTSRRFNPTTGDPEPVLVPINGAEIAKVLEAKRADVATLEAVLADIEAAEEKLA